MPKKIIILHKHPRNFANECDMIRCETEADAEAAEEDDYERLTNTEARKHISWLNGENDAWGSNRAFGGLSLQAILTDPRYLYRSA